PGGRSKERGAATHAPDSEPGRRVTEAASLRVGGTWAAKLLPSIAFDLRREPTAGKLHGGIWCSEASCHSSGCKSRQHKESSPCCSDTQRQGGRPNCLKPGSKSTLGPGIPGSTIQRVLRTLAGRSVSECAAI